MHLPTVCHPHQARVAPQVFMPQHVVVARACVPSRFLQVSHAAVPEKP